MVRKFSILAVLFLAACGDPLAGVDRASDLDLQQTDPVAAALPSAEEVAREGFLGTSATDAPVPEAALSEGLRPQPGGFLGRLLGRAAPSGAETTEASPDDATPVDATVTVDVPATETTVAAQDILSVDGNTAEAPVDAIAETQEPRGILGLFRRAEKPAASVDASVEANVQTAALTPPSDPPISSREVVIDPVRPGLFGGAARRNKPRTGPDATDVEYGTVLPFGVIARVCEARGRPMGRKVDKLGSRGFVLLDSAPNVVAKRTFYITGFKDGCPRQFTAATASFGAPSFYEQLRYSAAGQNLKMGETDRAYDKVKTSVCRVGKRKPCGAKIDRLDKTMAFVTAYEFLASSTRWSEYLVHSGEVLAASVKAR